MYIIDSLFETDSSRCYRNDRIFLHYMCPFMTIFDIWRVSLLCKMRRNMLSFRNFSLMNCINKFVVFMDHVRHFVSNWCIICLVSLFYGIITQRVPCECSDWLTCVPKPVRRVLRRQYDTDASSLNRPLVITCTHDLPEPFPMHISINYKIMLGLYSPIYTRCIPPHQTWCDYG